MNDEKTNISGIEQAFKKINDSLPKVKPDSIGYAYSVMESFSVNTSEYWKRLWNLLEEIFEEEGEELKAKNYVPVLSLFQGCLFDELYSDFKLYEINKGGIKAKYFETKYFIFNTTNDAFGSKTDEIDNYLSNLFFIPSIFLKSSRKRMMELIRQWMKENHKGKLYEEQNKTDFDPKKVLNNPKKLAEYINAKTEEGMSKTDIAISLKLNGARRLSEKCKQYKIEYSKRPYNKSKSKKK